MNVITGIEIQIVLTLTLLAIGAWFWAWRQAQLYRQSTTTRTTPPISTVNTPSTSLTQAGSALTQPPTHLRATISELIQNDPKGRYRFPLGWSVVNKRPVLSQAAFVSDINHVLLTGQSNSGKDNWAIVTLLNLATLHTPTQVQFAIIDGKGLDFEGWRGKAHTWHLALDPKEIGSAMHALSAERERRGHILRAANVSKWDHYQDSDLPLLIVFISEISLLQDAVGKTDLEQWLNTELSAGRAFGIRYIVSTQTASNFATRWRSQISLFVAGYQPNDSQDEPNASLPTKKIREAGAIPPSELPSPPVGAGIFCVVFTRVAVNVRAPYIDDNQRQEWLRTLPTASPASRHQDAVEALPIPTEKGSLDTHRKQGSTEAPISAEERTAIIEAARVETSRRKVALKLYGTAGGRSWDKVKRVCDEEGLLISEPVSAA